MKCLNRRNTNLAQRCLLLRNKLNRLHDKNIQNEHGLNRRDVKALKTLTEQWELSK